MSNGPLPFTCTTVGAFANAKWWALAGRKWNPPGARPRAVPG